MFATLPSVDLSVIIPARNEERRLGEQLDALVVQEWDGEWELIVVDNGSTDGTADLVRRYSEDFPRVRLLDASARADKSYAMNRAVDAARADSIAFCDADDIVAPGWLAAIANGLHRHDVVTGPNELDRLNPKWLADSRGRSIEEPVGSFGGIFPCIRGNDFGVTRRAWSLLGGMNEAYHPVEDIEFSYRCWANGIAIVGLPDAVVHYRYREAGRDLWRQGWKYGAGRVHIAKLLRDAGKPGPPRFGGWKSWVTLILALPTSVTRNGRARVLWIAGNRFGQVAGSIRHRTLML